MRERTGMHERTGPTRRAVLAAGSAGAVVGGAAVLAGCQSDASQPPPAGGGPGTVVASTSQVPVGGGLVVPEHQLVITQPAAGSFRAFSAICTHRGCLVSEVRDGTINCPCHGSRFSVVDGSVVQPASGAPFQQQPPLPPAPIRVTGDTIALA